MQCSTVTPARQRDREPLPPAGLEDWEGLVQYLPASLALDASARSGGALLRQREVKTASALLRLALGYAVCDWSIRLLGIWCELRGIGHLSSTAIRKRLAHCNGWLGTLVVALLLTRRLRLPTRAGALRLRIQDASVISRPGSQGTDWRVHLSLNVGQASIDGIELTDAHGGETVARFPVQPGEIRLVDSGYAHARGLGTVLREGGHLVVRINWQSVRLEEEDGRRFAVAEWLRALGPTLVGPAERSVWLTTPDGRFALRLVVCPLPAEKAEKARRRARQTARKNKHHIDQRTLLAAGFVLVLTNLPLSEWAACAVLDLYRLRWQVEMLIKRLKSLLVIDGLRAQSPELAQTYLLGKLLGALLLDEMMGQVTACVPDAGDVQTRLVSPWRIMALCQEVLKSLIRGSLTLTMIVNALPRLLRFMSDGPRRRPSQLVEAQRLLHALSAC
jgi:hypothetical protein